MTEELGVIQVVISVASQEEARTIANQLLEQRLAACVQISGPVESRYWWNQRIESAMEWLCTVKTKRELYSLVEQAIRACHSYQVAEILAVPVVAANPPYVDWLTKEVRSQ